MPFKLRELGLVLTILFTAASLQAAPPVLSINPEEYSYDLSVTAVLIEDCQELKNPANTLIARANGQLRGFNTSATIVNGRYLSFLTVYSNKPSGDTITFQIYNADTDKLVPVKTELIFQDDAIFGSPGAPQEIITNNRPENLNLSTLFVPEHPEPDQDLAVISATDADKDNTLIFTLVAGDNSTDNVSFKVDGNKIQFNGPVNTLTQDTFHIRLRAADNFSCFVEREFNLVVDKVNDAPTGLLISDSVFSENTPGPFIGSFTAVDQDLIDSFVYSLASGTGDEDNSHFAVSGISLFFKETANFEVKKTYSIRCRVTDMGGLTFEKVFTIDVKDNNDPPTGIALSNSMVFENEPKNQLIAKLFSIDEDAADKYTYSFANIGTNDNTSFRIKNDSLKANLTFDFETKSSYFIYLTSTDSSGEAVTKPFTISIKDTFDIPTGIQLTSTMLPENSPERSFIGVLSTEDANLPKPSKYNYSLMDGDGSTDNSSFQISNDSLYSSQVFDFELKKDYSIRIKTALPNGMSAEKVFAISLADVNETPSLITLQKDTVAENLPDSTLVSLIFTTDQEVNSNFNYALVSGEGSEDNTAFAIIQDRLILVKPANFEKKNIYKVRIRTTDSGGLMLETPFAIKITDQNDKPVVRVQTFEVPESAPVNTAVGRVLYEDEDANQTHTFWISPGLPVVVDPVTGIITTWMPLSYEITSTYRFYARVKDNRNPEIDEIAEQTLIVQDEIEDFLPSADMVSPNGDGKNDTWNITNVELYKNYSLQIVDEYSQLVYSAENNYDNSWDATYNGRVLPAGVYYYVFKSNSDNKVFKGYITIVK